MSAHASSSNQLCNNISNDISNPSRNEGSVQKSASRYIFQVQLNLRKYKDGSGIIVDDWRDYFRQLRAQAKKLDLSVNDLVNDLMQTADLRYAMSNAIFHQLGVYDKDETTKLRVAVSHGYDSITLTQGKKYIPERAMHGYHITDQEKADAKVYIAYVRNWARTGKYNKLYKYLDGLHIMPQDFANSIIRAVIEGAILGENLNRMIELLVKLLKSKRYRLPLDLVKYAAKLGDSLLVQQIITHYKLPIDELLIQILINAGDVKTIEALVQKYGSVQELDRTILASTSMHLTPRYTNLVWMLFRLGYNHPAIIKYALSLNDDNVPDQLINIAAPGFTLQQFERAYMKRKWDKYYSEEYFPEYTNNLSKRTIAWLLIQAIKAQRRDIIKWLLRYKNSAFAEYEIITQHLHNIVNDPDNQPQIYRKIVPNINKLAGKFADMELCTLLHQRKLLMEDIVGYWAVIKNHPRMQLVIIKLAQGLHYNKRLEIYGEMVGAAAKIADLKIIDQMAFVESIRNDEGLLKLNSLSWLSRGLNNAIIYQHNDTIIRLLEYGIRISILTLSEEAMKIALSKHIIASLLLEKSAYISKEVKARLEQS